MAKFKVGDRVKLINQEYIRPYVGIEIGFLGTVITVQMNGGYDVKFDNYGSSLFFVEKNLELVEPKEGFSIHGKILYYGEHYYIRREDTSFRELGYLNTYRDDGFQAIMTFTPVENKLHIPLNHIHIHRLYTRKEMSEQITKDKIKKAFERPMIFGGAIQGLFDIDEELMKRLRDIKPHLLGGLKISGLNYEVDKDGFIKLPEIEIFKKEKKESSMDFIEKQIEKHWYDQTEKFAYIEQPKKKINEAFLVGLPKEVIVKPLRKKVTLIWEVPFDSSYETTYAKAIEEDEFSPFFGFLLAYFKRCRMNSSKTQIKKELNLFVHNQDKSFALGYLISVFVNKSGLPLHEANAYIQKLLEEHEPLEEKEKPKRKYTKKSKKKEEAKLENQDMEAIPRTPLETDKTVTIDDVNDTLGYEVSTKEKNDDDENNPPF